MPAPVLRPHPTHCHPERSAAQSKDPRLLALHEKNILGAPGPDSETWDRTALHGAISEHLPHRRWLGGMAQLLTCLCFATALLTGCKPVGPNYVRPEAQAPATYKEAPAPLAPAAPADQSLRGDWWTIFHDPELDQLEAQIAAANPTLKQAMESYLAAHDQVIAARSSFFPKLSAGTAATRQQISSNGPSYSASKPTNYTDLQLTGTASWEPDLWGRVRRTVEAARSNAQAASADAANVNLILHAELAADYFQLRGLDAQNKLLTATVHDLEGQLDLTNRRLAGGIGTEADVAQAQTQLETVRTQLVDLGVARSHFEHAIGSLTARSELSLPVAPLDFSAVETLPQPPAGLPSQLLERRPDIAAAERRTAAANAQIGVAKSAFYPNITLGATGGFESLQPGTWIQGPSALWSLGAQGAELLFDAGQRHALTDEARHQYEAQAAAYKATVLAAFNDVEDQLSSLRILSDEAAVEARAVRSAQHSCDLANQRYQGGVTSYLEVLTAEATLLANQRTQLDLATRQYLASVALIRSLGGGWDATRLAP